MVFKEYFILPSPPVIARPGFEVIEEEVGGRVVRHAVVDHIQRIADIINDRILLEGDVGGLTPEGEKAYQSEFDKNSDLTRQNFIDGLTETPELRDTYEGVWLVPAAKAERVTGPPPTKYGKNEVSALVTEIAGDVNRTFDGRLTEEQFTQVVGGVLETLFSGIEIVDGAVAQAPGFIGYDAALEEYFPGDRHRFIRQTVVDALESRDVEYRIDAPNLLRERKWEAMVEGAVVADLLDRNLKELLLHPDKPVTQSQMQLLGITEAERYTNVTAMFNAFESVFDAWTEDAISDEDSVTEYFADQMEKQSKIDPSSPDRQIFEWGFDPREERRQGFQDYWATAFGDLNKKPETAVLEFMGFLGVTTDTTASGPIIDPDERKATAHANAIAVEKFSQQIKNMKAAGFDRPAILAEVGPAISSYILDIPQEVPIDLDVEGMRGEAQPAPEPVSAYGDTLRNRRDELELQQRTLDMESWTTSKAETEFKEWYISQSTAESVRDWTRLDSAVKARWTALTFQVGGIDAVISGLQEQERLAQSEASGVGVLGIDVSGDEVLLREIDREATQIVTGMMEFRDRNDVIAEYDRLGALEGYSASEIAALVQRNVFGGLTAEILQAKTITPEIEQAIKNTINRQGEALRQEVSLAEREAVTAEAEAVAAEAKYDVPGAVRDIAKELGVITLETDPFYADWFEDVILPRITEAVSFQDLKTPEDRDAYIRRALGQTDLMPALAPTAEVEREILRGEAPALPEAPISPEAIDIFQGLPVTFDEFKVAGPGNVFSQKEKAFFQTQWANATLYGYNLTPNLELVRPEQGQETQSFEDMLNTFRLSEEQEDAFVAAGGSRAVFQEDIKGGVREGYGINPLGEVVRLPEGVISPTIAEGIASMKAQVSGEIPMFPTEFEWEGEIRQIGKVGDIPSPEEVKISSDEALNRRRDEEAALDFASAQERLGDDSQPTAKQIEDARNRRVQEESSEESLKEYMSAPPIPTTAAEFATAIREAAPHDIGLQQFILGESAEIRAGRRPGTSQDFSEYFVGILPGLRKRFGETPQGVASELMRFEREERETEREDIESERERRRSLRGRGMTELRI